MPVQKHSPAELESFLRAALADAPYDLKAHGAWLFAYGSMLEDPPFDAMKRTTGVLQGFARRFCLTDPVLRGDEAIPGLTLGLAPGGACQGVLWRLAPERAEDDLRRFWPQEMQLPLYRPTWRPVAADEGAVRALVLLADTSGPLFQPPLAEGAVVERIARARGEKGANADYLFETAAALTRAGIPDAYLDRLASAVKRAQREPQES